MIKTVEEFQLAYSVKKPTKEQVAFLKDLNGRLKSRFTSWGTIFRGTRGDPGLDRLSVPNLFLHPVRRVHTLWYNHYYHSGLSPFGLASLFDTTPEVILEEVQKEQHIGWTFCSTTQLPVTYSGDYVRGMDLDNFKQWLSDRLGTMDGYYPSKKVHLTSYEELRGLWEEYEKAGEPRKFKSPNFPGVVREGTWNNLKRVAQLKEVE